LKVFGPDASAAVRGSVMEVKNVSKIAGTQQLRDLANFARSNNLIVEIFTNAPAPSRGILADLITEGVVVLRPLP
jgi:hypothetical protein